MYITVLCPGILHSTSILPGVFPCQTYIYLPGLLTFPTQINSAYLSFPRTPTHKEPKPDDRQLPIMAGAKNDAIKGDTLAVPPTKSESGSKAPTIAESEGYNKEVMSDTERTVDSADPEKEQPNELTQKKSNATQKSHTTTIREDGVEYPTGLKLGLITIALCLAVFLMALGKFSFRRVKVTRETNHKQITPSLRPLSQRSPISFTVYRTSAGMEVVCLSPPLQLTSNY